MIEPTSSAAVIGWRVDRYGYHVIKTADRFAVAGSCGMRPRQRPAAKQAIQSMIIALYSAAGLLLILSSIFLMLYRAYGRGWNDQAQRRAEVAKRALASRPASETA
ncbi:MAG: hypothetical protein ABWY82_01410 [Tardiphaga sp.]